MAGLDGVVRQHDVDAIRQGLNDGIQERHDALPVGCFHQVCDGGLRGWVDGSGWIEFASACADPGDIEVKEPDWVDLLLGLLPSISGKWEMSWRC